MGLRIKEINENLESINKEAIGLGLVARLADVPTLLDVSFETDSFTVDPIFIGRDDVVSEIVKMLTTIDESVISIIAIVGMGGLGKTTLARKVFNHQKNESTHQFGSHIWVHVSRKIDPISLFKKILKELNSDDAGSRQDILKKLQEALKDKTYILVLDDVWNHDLLKWEDFFNSLLGVTSTKGNVIVVTTRNKEVASIIKPFHTHELKGLSEEDCWSIIKEKAFGKEEDVRSEEFVAIGKNIGRRCQGSPLAANVVGGILRNKSKEKWISIEQKWLSRVEGEHIRKILKLSFDNLSPPSLKKCLAYCSMFPKGDKIMKHELIELWMAEGFLPPDGNNDVDSVGDIFINVLLHNSLLQVASRDEHGNVESCVMHDLVHESFLGPSNNPDGTSRVRYMNYSFRDEASRHIPKQVAKHLRTLFFEGETSGTVFSNFECLHVLTLNSYEVEELPSSIRHLIHLRHLDISNTRIKYLPDWIGELFYLLTLRASSLRKLPSTFKYLINLRHLYFDPRTDFELPAEIGKLTFLQMLKQFKVGDENGFKIEELGNLNNLKGNLEICNLERVPDKEEAQKANLYKKSNIVKLCFKWEREREGARETNDHENVLEGLQPHPNLQKLEINGFNGKRFPSWTMKLAVRNVARDSWVRLNKLIEVTLSFCYECEEIPTMGHLPNLKSLELCGLHNVKCINSSFYGSKDTQSVVFPSLERLKLETMPKLAEWAQVEFGGSSEVKVFPRLQHLVIRKCCKLFRIPSHFSPRLKHLEIVNTPLECLPDGLFYNNPNMSELEIDVCPLRELPDSLHTLTSLEKLKIMNCQNLKSIADSGGSFTSLRRLVIQDCDALVSLPCEIVGPLLEKLQLKNLCSLNNLPSLIDCLPKSPHLTVLRIVGVPQFNATCGVESWPFGSLERLSIDVSMGSSISMETMDGILQGCGHSLDRLSFTGMESWECMPESIQHLTGVLWLLLKNFGMEELPEWLGNLSSLRWLYLVNCKKLRRLPSMDAMQRLTELKWLDIKNCPELVIQSDGEGDSEWSKISHIPDITVNEHIIQCLRCDEE